MALERNACSFRDSFSWEDNYALLKLTVMKTISYYRLLSVCRFSVDVAHMSLCVCCVCVSGSLLSCLVSSWLVKWWVQQQEVTADPLKSDLTPYLLVKAHIKSKQNCALEYLRFGSLEFGTGSLYCGCLKDLEGVISWGDTGPHYNHLCFTSLVFVSSLKDSIRLMDGAERWGCGFASETFQSRIFENKDEKLLLLIFFLLFYSRISDHHRWSRWLKSRWR